ncbi:hypothetical protein [Arthrobacter sp. ISL-30]|uniref:hypothetical protein n=1 Tax=Arthrobacter sp. ISL-30 TaxID=2819109 RepID=UPI0020354743|nr:hypothetical protein [Arthrobacter sp. ISL-30]
MTPLICSWSITPTGAAGGGGSTATAGVPGAAVSGFGDAGDVGTVSDGLAGSDGPAVATGTCPAGASAADVAGSVGRDGGTDADDVGAAGAIGGTPGKVACTVQEVIAKIRPTAAAVDPDIRENRGRLRWVVLRWVVLRHGAEGSVILTWLSRRNSMVRT